MGVFTRLRRPEHVGENRCLPCTVVNVAIAAAAGVVVGTWAAGPGAVVFAACLGAIYLGGTPFPTTPR